ncbi:MAG TPA: winged helix-turn-helix domain-containing protein [Oculatellaceae cyanobacterium]
MNPEPIITATAALIADPARTSMLMMLMDGRAYPAGELACAAGVTAQTASSHLAKLLAGGLVEVETEGRHRYYRLAGPHIVATLKRLASVSPTYIVRRKSPDPEANHLRFARTCYDHLAGRLGVAIAKAMFSRNYFSNVEGKTLIVTASGAEWFRSRGLDIGQIEPGRHGIARRCLDWTEREHHIAGPLGTQFFILSCTAGWFHRPIGSRVVEITPKGWSALNEHFDIRQGLPLSSA